VKDPSGKQWNKAPFPMEEMKPLIEESYAKLEPQFRHLTVWIALQMIAAQVIESAIVLDRFLYIEEHGAKAFIVPLFDPIISPRNLAIVAVKKERVSEIENLLI
jgi:hypothetical protein